MAALTPPPTTPGVGARRNHFPKLPLSAFAATSASTIPGAPAPSSPSSIHPASIIDAHVAIKSVADLGGQKADSAFDTKLNGVVVVLSTADGADKVLDELKGAPSAASIKAVGVPVALASGAPSTPSFLTGAPFPISVYSTVSKSTVSPSLVEGVSWALDAGFPLELDVQGTSADDAEGYEYLAELISSAQDASQKKPTPIILTNVLPPQSSVDLPIVKLLSHPGYIAYQAHVGSLSLVPNTFLKFIPPTWDTVGEGEDGLLSESQVKEWKRRVKMYLGPAVEAFGEDRIIFGTSSASPDGRTRIRPVDWYSLARESITEIGVEQEGVDGIFSGNALSIYSKGSL